MSFINFIKPSVRALETYAVKGKPLQAGLIKLNQNENPFDVPESIKKEILSAFALSSWNRYPETFPLTLLKALSEFTKHPVEGIIAGNGSNELMYTILMATVTKGTKVLIPQPSFFLYEKAVRVFDGEVIPILMNGDFSFPTQKILDAAHRAKPSVIVLVSPNSPTGQSMPVAGVEEILKLNSSLVIVDEAYVEFSEKQSVQSLLSRYDNLVVLRTFSKAFSMAGLRIGYLLTNPGLRSELLKPKIPFTVNNFSAATAMTLMKHTYLVTSRIAEIKQQKKAMWDAVQTIPSVEAFPSDTNFFIFRTPLDAVALFQQLLERNVLVRDVSSYPMLERTLRVNVGTEKENKKFLATLRTIFSTGTPSKKG
ncbi:MAG: histidinol-phosphate transaminase [Bacteroidota bacterium]|nr:histidinol-phosphate transaminase [Bacteroidota bacterium]